MSKLKMWNRYSNWEEAEKIWDVGSKDVSQTVKIRSLSTLPSMVGITEETAKNLKWKSLKWMISHDTDGKIRKQFLKHPFKYTWRYLKSVFKNKSYSREEDLFFYGLSNEKEFQSILKDPNAVLVVGFSYCHKPFECPSGRFTENCIADPEHPVCRQCFIGKTVNSLPEQGVIPLFIPTIHYVAGKLLELIDAHPSKKFIFLITACEMTLEMFGDWGNMAGIQGIGVRLDGRICNTMRAFELSEKGVKPGLTVVLPQTQKKILSLIRSYREK